MSKLTLMTLALNSILALAYTATQPGPWVGLFAGLAGLIGLALATFGLALRVAAAPLPEDSLLMEESIRGELGPH